MPFKAIEGPANSFGSSFKIFEDDYFDKATDKGDTARESDKLFSEAKEWGVDSDYLTSASEDRASRPDVSATDISNVYRDTLDFERSAISEMEDINKSATEVTSRQFDVGLGDYIPLILVAAFSKNRPKFAEGFANAYLSNLEGKFKSTQERDIGMLKDRAKSIEMRGAYARNMLSAKRDLYGMQQQELKLIESKLSEKKNEFHLQNLPVISGTIQTVAEQLVKYEKARAAASLSGAPAPAIPTFTKEIAKQHLAKEAQRLNGVEVTDSQLELLYTAFSKSFAEFQSQYLTPKLLNGDFIPERLRETRTVNMDSLKVIPSKDSNNSVVQSNLKDVTAAFDDNSNEIISGFTKFNASLEPFSKDGGIALPVGNNSIKITDRDILEAMQEGTTMEDYLQSRGRFGTKRVDGQDVNLTLKEALAASPADAYDELSYFGGQSSASFTTPRLLQQADAVIKAGRDLLTMDNQYFDTMYTGVITNSLARQHEAATSYFKEVGVKETEFSGGFKATADEMAQLAALIALDVAGKSSNATYAQPLASGLFILTDHFKELSKYGSEDPINPAELVKTILRDKNPLKRQAALSDLSNMISLEVAARLDDSTNHIFNLGDSQESRRLYAVWLRDVTKEKDDPGSVSSGRWNSFKAAMENVKGTKDHIRQGLFERPFFVAITPNQTAPQQFINHFSKLSYSEWMKRNSNPLAGLLYQ